GGDELLIGGIERRGDVVEIARDRGGTRLAGAFGTRRRAGADHARHVGPPGVEGNLRRAARCAGSGTEDTMGVYDYPLLIKNLLLGSTRQPTRNRIQYRDNPGYDYATFGQRVARLGGALGKLGVKRGDTVAVMDWDTPRFLECFFAIPMIGAVLQTVNVRLS